MQRPIGAGSQAGIADGIRDAQDWIALSARIRRDLVPSAELSAVARELRSLMPHLEPDGRRPGVGCGPRCPTCRTVNELRRPFTRPLLEGLPEAGATILAAAGLLALFGFSAGILSGDDAESSVALWGSVFGGAMVALLALFPQAAQSMSRFRDRRMIFWPVLGRRGPIGAGATCG